MNDTTTVSKDKLMTDLRVVIADAEAGDDLQPREQLDEGSVDARVAAAHCDTAHFEIGLADHGELIVQATLDHGGAVADSADRDVLAHALPLRHWRVNGCRAARRTWRGSSGT